MERKGFKKAVRELEMALGIPQELSTFTWTSLFWFSIDKERIHYIRLIQVAPIQQCIARKMSNKMIKYTCF